MYTCPDHQDRTFEYSGPLPQDDMVLYINPRPVYPFDPLQVRITAPQFINSGFLCAGTCALWAYVVHLALVT